MKHQQELIKILNLDKEATWADIYVAIGKLQANENNITYIPQDNFPKWQVPLNPPYYVTC